MAERLSRQELYDLVWSEPALKLAPRLGVSDVWLAKVCSAANVPRPSRGYWAKLRSGKPPAQVPLPDSKPGMREYVFLRRRAATGGQTQQRKARVLSATSRPIRVPERLNTVHPTVRRTSELAESAVVDDAGRILFGPVSDAFNVRVSRSVLSRTKRILQAICEEVARRGWEINSRSTAERTMARGARVQIGRQLYEVIIEEKVESLPFTEEEIRKWRATQYWESREQPPAHLRRRRATGELTLRLPSAWDGSQSSWSDGKRARVESKLPEFFASLNLRAERDEERDQDREREEAARLERQRRDWTERLQLQRLDEDLAAMQKAELVRFYVTRLRARLNALDYRNAEDVVTWCDWADGYADRIDPTVNLDLINGLEDEVDW